MNITLKDGSVKSYDAPMRVIDIAADISAGLARVACAGELNGEEVSESRFRPFAEDARGIGRNRNTTLSNAEAQFSARSA